jgi:hypothetical protein
LVPDRFRGHEVARQRHTAHKGNYHCAQDRDGAVNEPFLLATFGIVLFLTVQASSAKEFKSQEIGQLEQCPLGA